jgi:cell division protein FtsB
MRWSMQKEISMFAPKEPENSPVPAAPLSRRQRLLNWAQRVWRPAGTAVAILLALLLTWHVIHGKHGLSFWQQKRVEDRALENEIRELQQENGALHSRIEQLKSDPEAIEQEARKRFHYARPGEVIYTLPAEPAHSAK